MIKTIIIEDEKPAARRLEKLLTKFDEVQLVASLHSVEETIAWFQENEHPQLIFSDIVLGDGLSFDIFDAITTKAFIIYTTAFDQYTLRAFKLNSIDYLLKPIEEEDLAKAIDKFQSFLPEQTLATSQEIRQIVRKEKATLSRILVKMGYHLKVVSIHEVSCFFSENKMVYLQTKDRSFPTGFTLDELETVLEKSQFFRVNRQFIICSEFIKNIHTSPYCKVELAFQPEEEITVSRDRVKNFKEWLAGG